MNKTNIVIVRHGETVWNTEGRMQGHLDSSLTDKGMQQAELLADRLKDESFDCIYSSDLGRAVDTAQAVASMTDHAVVTDKRIREKSFGVLQGLTMAEQQAARDNGGDDLDSGECLTAFSERVMHFFDDIAAAHHGERVLVVTHGGVLSLFLRLCLGLPQEAARKFRLPNAAMNTVDNINGEWIIGMIGDTYHLNGEVALDESYAYSV